jgi:hypothetical protein
MGFSFISTVGGLGVAILVTVIRPSARWARFVTFSVGGWTASTVVIDAGYVSSRYGGIRIYWRVYTSSPANWREFDQQIWLLLSEWGVADESQGPPKTASGQ